MMGFSLWLQLACSVDIKSTFMVGIKDLITPYWEKDVPDSVLTQVKNLLALGLSQGSVKLQDAFAKTGSGSHASLPAANL